MFDKILIANRGEIALRVLRACKELGIPTVAVHSTADADAMHVRFADESVCIGPPRARRTAISTSRRSSRPARSPAPTRCIPATAFCPRTRALPKSSPTTASQFIGPKAEHIRTHGRQDRGQAHRQAPRHSGACRARRAASAPTTRRAKIAGDIGFPVLIKAAAGGGGRGMKVARTADELSTALSTARAEAKAAFGDDAVYIEKYLEKPRHIEIQVLGDGKGNAIHLGERDCSLQRRHQKVWEEGPSPALNAEARDAIGETVAKAMREIGYLGVGTVEFLYEDGEFYFIEMNTRIQVEHPVTEMITDIDLIFEQIRVAAGTALTLKQSDIKFHGHAIECRINAENPGVLPPLARQDPALSPAGRPRRAHRFRRLSGLHHPAVLRLTGRQADRARQDAHRMPDAAAGARSTKLVVDGIETTLPLFRALVRETDIIDGNYHIHWLEQFLARGGMEIRASLPL